MHLKGMRNVLKTLGFFAVMVGLVGAPVLASVARNEVRSQHIANGQVRSPDIQNGGVRSADIQNGGVASLDIQTGGVQSVDILDQTVGSADLGTGSVGNDELGTFAFRSVTEPIGAGTAELVSSPCNAGERAIGVSTTWGLTIFPFSIHAEDNDLVIGQASVASTGVSAVGRNNDASTWSLTVTAICLG